MKTRKAKRVKRRARWRAESSPLSSLVTLHESHVGLVGYLTPAEAYRLSEALVAAADETLGRVRFTLAEGR